MQHIAREEPCHVHVDIFFLKNKKFEVYELRDDNKNYVFANILFRECFIDFEKDSDASTVRKIEPDEIRKRLTCLKMEILIGEDVEFKIERAIQYIEKNYEYYYGIRTIY